MSDKDKITLTINGRDHAIAVEPRRTLADAIREDCGQTGTHIGCEHGICGACSIMLDGDPVRSCLMFAVQADGHRITTVDKACDSCKRSGSETCRKHSLHPDRMDASKGSSARVERANAGEDTPCGLSKNKTAKQWNRNSESS